MKKIKICSYKKWFRGIIAGTVILIYFLIDQGLTADLLIPACIVVLSCAMYLIEKRSDYSIIFDGDYIHLPIAKLGLQHKAFFISDVSVILFKSRFGSYVQFFDSKKIVNYMKSDFTEENLKQILSILKSRDCS